jgi:hypothetical protein
MHEIWQVDCILSTLCTYKYILMWNIEYIVKLHIVLGSIICNDFGSILFHNTHQGNNTSKWHIIVTMDDRNPENNAIWVNLGCYCSNTCHSMTQCESFQALYQSWVAILCIEYTLSELLIAIKYPFEDEFSLQILQILLEGHHARNINAQNWARLHCTISYFITYPQNIYDR